MKRIKEFCQCLKIGVVALSVAIANMTVGGAVMAAEDAPEYRLAITPTQKDLNTIKPGRTYTGEFEIRNTGKHDFRYEISFSPYSVETETYEPDYEKETKYTDIAKWITVDAEEGFLKAGENVTLKYKVDVPENAHAGAQAATIMVTMTNDNEANDTAVQTVRQLGYLVYGNVDGETVKTAEILENKIPSFLFKPPVQATSLVENTGNIYTVAKYSVQVFPLFGDEEIYTNEENPDGNIIFPETRRYNTVSWDGAPQLGIFRVRQTIEIFDEKSVEEKIVFLCPIWFLFIVLLLIFFMIFWIISRIVKRRNEK